MSKEYTIEDLDVEHQEFKRNNPGYNNTESLFLANKIVELTNRIQDWEMSDKETLIIREPQFIELVVDLDTKVMERISSIDSIQELSTGTRVWFYNSDGKKYEEGTDFLNPYKDVAKILRNISERVIDLWAIRKS